MFSDNVILGALIIFVVRVVSIAVSTVRLLIMGRASSVLVMSLAFIEALAFALTFGQVAQNLGNIWNLMAYCLGYAAGTLVGMWIEDRVGAGFGATRSEGEGTSGTVGLVRVVARRTRIAQIRKVALEVDPKAFVTVEETRSVSQGFLG